MSEVDTLQQFFLSLIKRGKLHHAYCLVGPSQSAKKQLTFSLAAKILQTTVDRLLLHPDFLLIAQEINEKTGKTKRDIDVEQIQHLREFSSTHPFQGGKKVVVIDEAEKMNEHSSNALLKTLEEPRGNTIFFLLSQDETQLLPTIRSRVELVCLTSGQKEPYTQEIVQQFVHLFAKPFYQKLQLVENIFGTKGDKKDAIADRENLQNILTAWEVVNRDWLLKTLGEEDKCVHLIESEKIYPAATFLAIEKKILEAKKYVQQNVHPRLLIEQILLAIP